MPKLTSSRQPACLPEGSGRARLRYGVVGSSEVGARALWAAARAGCDYEISAIHPSRASFDSYRALLGSGVVDAVYLGIPGARSFDYALAALGAGVHVLCDELPSANGAQWSALARATRSRSAPPVLSTRSEHACIHRAATALARSEGFGSLRAFSAVACTRRIESDSLVLECLNAARRAFGAEPDAVVGVSRSLFPSVLSVALHFPPDCLAFIACGFDRDPCLRYDVSASEGDVRVVSAPGSSGSDELFATVAGVRLERRFARGDALGDALASFARDLSDGTALGIASRAQADARILDAIERAGASGSSVRLKASPFEPVGGRTARRHAPGARAAQSSSAASWAAQSQ
jgi:predicted dehydrogenase